MAKSTFDMNTSLSITNIAAAKTLSAKLKAQHHKDLLDIIIEAQPDGAVTCQQVVDSYVTDGLNEEQLRIYTKYSKRAHMQYLVNRCRGIVTATTPSGEVIKPATTAGKEPKKVEAVVEAPVTVEEAALVAAE